MSKNVHPLTEAKRQAKVLRKEIAKLERTIKAQEQVKCLTLKMVDLQQQVKYPSF